MTDSLTIEPESGFICACHEEMRSACVGEPFYKEHKGHCYCVLHFPNKEKGAAFEKAFQRKLGKQDYNFCGVWFPDVLSFFNFKFYRDVDFSSATFSAEADFSSAIFNKKASFRSAIFHADVEFDSSIFRLDADFVSVTFMAASSFRFACFEGTLFFRNARFSLRADFTKCTFEKNAYFISVSFRSAGFGASTFTKVAHFTSSKFEQAARFNGATFGAEAYFGHVTFCAAAKFERANFKARAHFNSVTFQALTDFNSANFCGRADYSEANFLDYARLAGSKERSLFGDQADLDLQFARTANPEHISFHTVTLRPHWFVNIDPTSFDFINVKWSNLLPQGSDSGIDRKMFRHSNHRALIEQEVDCLIKKRISTPYRLLSIACRRLAVNAEESYRYGEASRFRYWSMELRRRNKQASDDFAPSKLHSLYYLVSRYGEGIGRAFSVLIGIWLAFAIAYLITGHVKIVESNRWHDYPAKLAAALNYSLQVITLQRPDKPIGFLTPIFVTLETILGPVQAALLALAIRRKFMR